MVPPRYSPWTSLGVSYQPVAPSVPCFASARLKARAMGIWREVSGA